MKGRECDLKMPKRRMFRDSYDGQTGNQDELDGVRKWERERWPEHLATKNSLVRPYLSKNPSSGRGGGCRAPVCCAGAPGWSGGYWGALEKRQGDVEEGGERVSCAQPHALRCHLGSVCERKPGW